VGRYTNEIRARFAAMVAGGTSTSAAAEALGISERTAARWAAGARMTSRSPPRAPKQATRAPDAAAAEAAAGTAPPPAEKVATGTGATPPPPPPDVDPQLIVDVIRWIVRSSAMRHALTLGLRNLPAEFLMLTEGEHRFVAYLAPATARRIGPILAMLDRFAPYVLLAGLAVMVVERRAAVEMWAKREAKREGAAGGGATSASAEPPPPAAPDPAPAGAG